MRPFWFWPWLALLGTLCARGERDETPYGFGDSAVLDSQGRLHWRGRMFFPTEPVLFEEDGDIEDIPVTCSTTTAISVSYGGAEQVVALPRRIASNDFLALSCKEVLRHKRFSGHVLLHCEDGDLRAEVLCGCAAGEVELPSSKHTRDPLRVSLGVCHAKRHPGYWRQKREHPAHVLLHRDLHEGEVATRDCLELPRKITGPRTTRSWWGISCVRGHLVANITGCRAQPNETGVLDMAERGSRPRKLQDDDPCLDAPNDQWWGVICASLVYQTHQTVAGGYLEGTSEYLGFSAAHRRGGHVWGYLHLRLGEPPDSEVVFHRMGRGLGGTNCGWHRWRVWEHHLLQQAAQPVGHLHSATRQLRRDVYRRREQPSHLEVA